MANGHMNTLYGEPLIQCGDTLLLFSVSSVLIVHVCCYCLCVCVFAIHTIHTMQRKKKKETPCIPGMQNYTSLDVIGWDVNATLYFLVVSNFCQTA